MAGRKGGRVSNRCGSGYTGRHTAPWRETSGMGARFGSLEFRGGNGKAGKDYSFCRVWQHSTESKAKVGRALLGVLTALFGTNQHLALTRVAHSALLHIVSSLSIPSVDPTGLLLSLHMRNSSLTAAVAIRFTRQQGFYSCIAVSLIATCCLHARPASRLFYTPGYRRCIGQICGISLRYGSFAD